MRFSLDNGLSPRLIPLIIEAGHDAIHHDALLPARSPDAIVADTAAAAERCLITRDFDSSDTREFMPRRFKGIVVLAVPRNGGPNYIAALLREFLPELPRLGDLRGKLLIVEPGRIRVRE